MPDSSIRSLVVVCAGNIYRSPMAEGFFKDRLAQHPMLKTVVVSSAGTIAYDGNLPSADAVNEMYDRFVIDISQYRAQSVSQAIETDLILTMDRATTAEVEALLTDVRVVMLGDYAGTGEEVADPYGGPRLGYRVAAEQIQRLVDAAVRRLETETQADDPLPNGDGN